MVYYPKQQVQTECLVNKLSSKLLKPETIHIVASRETIITLCNLVLYRTRTTMHSVSSVRYRYCEVCNRMSPQEHFHFFHMEQTQLPNIQAEYFGKYFILIVSYRKTFHIIMLSVTRSEVCIKVINSSSVILHCESLDEYWNGNCCPSSSFHQVALNDC